MPATCSASWSPSSRWPQGSKGEHVTHDPKEAALYDNDPLLISKVRAGWFVAVEAAMAEVPNLVSSLNLPIYWTHGEMDPVASFDQSRAVFDKITTKNKTFVRSLACATSHCTRSTEPKSCASSRRGRRRKPEIGSAKSFERLHCFSGGDLTRLHTAGDRRQIATQRNAGG